jgi:hypothetical protein
VRSAILKDPTFKHRRRHMTGHIDFVKDLDDNRPRAPSFDADPFGPLVLIGREDII